MPSVNKQAVAAAFGRAAASYHQHDALQRQSAQALRHLLGAGVFPRVLDAGCGPGTVSREWRLAGSEVTALDLSGDMLAQAAQNDAADRYLQADIESLPLADAGFDLVWSNLAVQWCNSLSGALTELYRVLRPGGKLAFTTLVDASLPELNHAWQTVDSRAHANRFLPLEAIQQALQPWRHRGGVVSISVPFADALSAMRSLKGIGATHLHDGRSEQPLTRQRLRQLQLAWPKQQGLCPLTYHIFTGVIDRD